MVGAATLVARPTPPSAAEELVQSVDEVMRSVLHRVHPTLESEGITMGQFWALHRVANLRSTSLSEVARHLYVSAPTVCANIDQLESAGLVTRQRSARDRRAVELTLTAKGRRVESRVWARIGRVMADAAGEMPGDDVAVAVRVFRALNRRLESDLDEAHGGEGR